ncbi:hypothetical protein R6Q59_012728 [Mikania micrantha]
MNRKTHLKKKETSRQDVSGVLLNSSASPLMQKLLRVHAVSFVQNVNKMFLGDLKVLCLS